MADKLIDQLRKAVELQGKATPGPFETSREQTDGVHGLYYAYAVIDEEGETIVETSNSTVAVIESDDDSQWDEVGRKNCEFFVAARNLDLAAVLKRLERAERIEKAAREIVDCESIRELFPRPHQLNQLESAIAEGMAL